MRRGALTEEFIDNKEYPSIALFDDTFLVMDKKILRFRFDATPKSYKKNIRESKTETLGSQYSYITRNGQIKYNTFDLRGTISYESDITNDLVDGYFEDSISHNDNISQVILKDDIDGKMYLLGVENSKIYLEETQLDATIWNDLVVYTYDELSNRTWNNFKTGINIKSVTNPSIEDDATGTSHKISATRNGILTLGNGQVFTTAYNVYDNNHIFLEEKEIFNYKEVAQMYEDLKEEQRYNQYEFIKEREFREKTLDVLYCGKPFLLKTLTEGNHIVKLTNISLTPRESIGNLVYDFSATATEITDFNLQNLYDNKVISHETLSYLSGSNKINPMTVASTCYLSDGEITYELKIKNKILYLEKVEETI